MTAHDRIVKQRINLLKAVGGQPFYGLLVTRLLLKEDNSQPTGYTDGRVIGYGTEFIDKLTDNQIRAFLEHEALHICFLHITRRNGRDPLLWNIAGDYIINRILTKQGAELPPGCLLDDKYDNDWTVDRVYDDLFKHAKKIKGFYNFGACRDANGGKDTQKTEAGMRGVIAEAARSAKSRGSLPAGLERIIDEIVNPLIDWRLQLRPFVDSCRKEDYSWTKPSRRLIHRGLYFPGLYSEGWSKITVAIDTSGSICGDILKQFIGEVVSIADETGAAVEMIWCDAEIGHIQTFEPGELVSAGQFEPRGGGGTDFRPVFAHCDESPPKVLIYLTDLYGEFPETPPNYPVIWATMTKDADPPFGDVVRMQDE